MNLYDNACHSPSYLPGIVSIFIRRINCLCHFITEIFAHFIPHVLHQSFHAAGILFIEAAERIIVGQGLHSRLFGFRRCET